MEAASIPQPRSLQADAMLPFALWPVADLIDGHRTVSAIANALSLSVGTVVSALGAIERELGVTLTDRAVVPTPVSTPSMTAADAFDIVVDAAVNLVGPMGEVIAEDAIDEVGETASAADLAYRVAQDLREPQRSTFLAKVRAKGIA
ncbi:hypothetical protein [Deinococcus yavapaiensis]|uniref:DUF8082 domain-containing protein n=1 Tax=Deinococcus yavapaiensis KR-236 TaxID=694435 RepID=A0A318SFR4_9DEIO|nr:hypothetical protein [Deinococcus yavapaiensis]PYE55716.1 hypothetical protein DES52_10279 [Deinococcus yavapaiensis KR-236]